MAFVPATGPTGAPVVTCRQRGLHTIHSNMADEPDRVAWVDGDDNKIVQSGPRGCAPYYADEAVTLYHDDCRELMPRLPAANVLVTDPPYASAAATVTTGRAKQKWGGNWGDMSLVTLMAEVTLDKANLTPEHEVYWFADHLSYAALMPLFFRRYPTVQSIIWDKDALGMGSYYRRQTEFIIYARTRNAPEFASKSARDLIRLKADYGTREHPAQKPIGLMVELLKNSTGIVLDPYAGSGTTLLAARQLGRKSVGIEIEQPYCELIAKRFAQDVLPLGQQSTG